MKTITVRGVDEHLSDGLKKMSAREGKSVNQFILETLKGRLGLRKEKKFTAVHHDLDHLFGRWDEKEFKMIQRKITTERKIDKELWE